MSNWDCSRYYYPLPPCARVRTEREKLESRRKQIVSKIESLEREKDQIDDQIKELEIKEQAA